MIIGSPHINPTVTHSTRKQACHLQSECEEGRKPSNSTDDYLDVDWFISDHKTVYCSVLLLDISAANLISFNCSAFVPSIKSYTSVGHQDNMNKRQEKNSSSNEVIKTIHHTLLVSPTRVQKQGLPAWLICLHPEPHYCPFSRAGIFDCGTPLLPSCCLFREPLKPRSSPIMPPGFGTGHSLPTFAILSASSSICRNVDTSSSTTWSAWLAPSPN